MFVAVIVIAFSAATMLLWNWLMPAIFGITTICFWQALGLLLLCRILLGGMVGRPGFGKMRNRRNMIYEKWLKMTPEEQQEFLKKRHFGHGFMCNFFQNNKTEKQE